VPASTTPILEVFTTEEALEGVHTCSLQISVDFAVNNAQYAPYVAFQQEFDIEISHACDSTSLVVPTDFPLLS